MTKKLLPQAEWRSLELVKLAADQKISLNPVIAGKLLDDFDIKNFGDAVDYMARGGDFAGDKEHSVDYTTVLQAALADYANDQRVDHVTLEHFPFGPQTNGKAKPRGKKKEEPQDESTTAQHQAAADTADAEPPAQDAVVPDQADVSAADTAAAEATAAESKAMPDIEVRRQPVVRDERLRRLLDDQDHLNHIRNKRREQVIAMLELEAVKAKLKVAKERCHVLESELAEMLAADSSPQAYLPRLGPFDDPPTSYEPDKTSDVAPQEAVAAKGDGEQADGADDPGGWTASNWRVAPVTVLNLTAKQIENAKALKCDLCGQLFDLQDPPTRLHSKLIAWLEACQIDLTLQTSSDEPAPPAVVQTPGLPSRVQLTKDVDDTLVDGLKFDVVRHVGNTPVIVRPDGQELCLVDATAYDVLESWPTSA